MTVNPHSLPNWLARGMADLFPDGNPDDVDQALAARLAAAELEGRPLRVKLGIDPTGSDIHLGHSILFRKLRAFQDAGHTAVLIIGDFTARIGDPTGKSATRVQLTTEQVEANATTYLRQLGEGQPKEQALLDFETPGRLEVRRNSEWLEGLDLPQVIGLLGTATVGQMLAKDDFAKRYGSGTPIACMSSFTPCFRGTTLWLWMPMWSWGGRIRNSMWRWDVTCNVISAKQRSSAFSCQSSSVLMECRR